ncbi:MAG: DNA gyrase inhibitor YacG [Sphingobium sp.]
MSPKPPSCPLCGAPSSPPVRPFCGTACRDRDLLAWLGDGYRVPGASVEDSKESGDYGLDREED